MVPCLLAVGCGPVAQNASTNRSSPPAGPTHSSTHPTTAATPSPAATPARHVSCGSTPDEQFLGNDVLTAIQFVSPAQGWAVGQHVILATTDGGQHWTTQDSGRLDLVSVDFISSQTGWALGLHSLLVTHDGGQHWTRLDDPCPAIRSVHFLSAQTGYAIAGGSTLLEDEALAPQAGGTLLVTSDGGQSWRPLASPASPQSVCFASPTTGWLGADGSLYRSTDGGRSWQRAAAVPKQDQFTMFVQCAGPGSVWGLDIGFGAASSQEPHIGYYGSLTQATALFAEQYFPHPGVVVNASAPGAYAGPLSAISPEDAAFVDSCSPCGQQGTAPWDLAAGSGANLVREGNVGEINYPIAASFLSPDVGWVVGTEGLGSKTVLRIVHTADGGISWQTQWTG
jgi:hypothetical protein